VSDDREVPKLFYTTGEACLMAGINPHTLRYWERKMKLSFLRSPKGKRMLRIGDIERLKKVSSLLREGYSLKAVPARIRESIQMDLPLRQGMGGHRRMLKRVRDRLEDMVSNPGGEAGK
jgi:DNA-binding transcriptional MerR regulator